MYLLFVCLAIYFHGLDSSSPSSICMYVLEGDTEPASNRNTVVWKSDGSVMAGCFLGCVAVSYGRDQSVAMAAWSQTPPNHRELWNCLWLNAQRRFRSCRPARQEQQQDAVEWINVGGEETGQGWEVIEFGRAYVLSAAGAEALERVPRFGFGFALALVTG